MSLVHDSSTEELFYRLKRTASGTSALVHDSTKQELFYRLFISPFSIAITSLWERELILVLFVHLFDLCLFGFVGFLFLLVSGKGCGL